MTGNADKSASQMPLTRANEIVKNFMSRSQFKAFTSLQRGEEGEFYRIKAINLASLIEAAPKSYEQDGLGDEAVAHLHYFKGSTDFYITEKDMEAEQHQAFGLAIVNSGDPQLGYISLVELAENDVELDLHFTPNTLREIKSSLTQKPTL